MRFETLPVVARRRTACLHVGLQSRGMTLRQSRRSNAKLSRQGLAWLVNLKQTSSADSTSTVYHEPRAVEP